MTNKTHLSEQEQVGLINQSTDMIGKNYNPIKEEFRKYLSEKLKSASRYLAALDNRVREYIRRLVDPEADSVFSYTTTEDIIKCIKILEDSDEFNIANEKSSGLMHAALLQYSSFISIIEIKNKEIAHPNNSKDTVLNFEEVSEISAQGKVCCHTLEEPKTFKGNKPRLLSYLPRPFKKRNSNDTVFSSIFSPAEVKRDSHLLVSVFLHLREETETVISLAKESDSFATRHGYRPLPCNLSKGDIVDIQLSIMGKTRLFSEKQNIVWQGVITSCSFNYYVPSELDENELCCSAVLTVNGIPIGDMKFITRIVEQPIARNPKVVTQPYEKIFISYAHQDENTVKHYAKAFQLLRRDVFFDRDYLKAGDLFSQEIEKYINSADLFILFWSENAAKSAYVQKELALALPRAFPQIQPYEKAKLRISPISINPQTELPANMKETYHFEEIL